jgi:hypothetical protein
VDYRDPDDPETALGVVQRQDDPARAWQDARRQVLLRCDLFCEVCGAEHRRKVWRRLWSDPPTWWAPIVPGQKAPHVLCCAVETVLVVVPVALPWSGELVDLVALCMGCWVRREVEAAHKLKLESERQIPPQRSLF